ncbi:hypothetical protein ACJX0J_037445, partial [Zea mays]
VEDQSFFFIEEKIKIRNNIEYRNIEKMSRVLPSLVVYRFDRTLSRVNNAVVLDNIPIDRNNYGIITLLPKIKETHTITIEALQQAAIIKGRNILHETKKKNEVGI